LEVGNLKLWAYVSNLVCIGETGVHAHTPYSMLFTGKQLLL